MTIYTRYGSEVEIVSGDLEKGEVIVLRVLDDSVVRGARLCDLRADGGIAEIIRAVEDLEEVTDDMA